MRNITSEKREQLVFCLAYATAVLAVLSVFAITGFEAYVRWALNKDFTFLGGSSLAALIIATFILMTGLVYAYRPTNR